MVLLLWWEEVWKQNEEKPLEMKLFYSSNMNCPHHRQSRDTGILHKHLPPPPSTTIIINNNNNNNMYI